MSYKIIKHALWFFLPLIIGSTNTLKAIEYTAILSGNWSNNLIWAGGIAPPATLSMDDQVIIPIGTEIMLDVDLEIKSELVILQIDGALTGNTDIVLENGMISGSGTLEVDDLIIMANGRLLMTGNLICSTLTNSNAQLILTANTSIGSRLILSDGTLEFNNAVQLLFQAGSTIELAGGQIFLGNSSISSNGNINLVYSGHSSTTGDETSITGIGSLTVDLQSETDQLILSNDLIINDSLNLVSGKLVLNTKRLTLKGSIYSESNSSLMLDNQADILIQSQGNVGLLPLANDSNDIDTFQVNISNRGSVVLGGNLNVIGNLQLHAGQLALFGNDLSIKGGFESSDDGRFFGDADASILVQSANDIGPLTFDTNGQILDQLSIDMSSRSCTLGTDLNVFSELNLASGKFVLNSNHLSISGALNINSASSIIADSEAGLTISGNASRDSLIFHTQGQVLGNLIIKTDTSSVRLGSDLQVENTLRLESGTLILNGYSLDINNDNFVQLNGNIKADSNAELFIYGMGSSSSILFSADGQVLGNLILSIPEGNIELKSDLSITNNLHLVAGDFVIEDQLLLINGSFNTNLETKIHSNLNSSIIINTSQIPDTLHFSNQAGFLYELNIQNSGGPVVIDGNLTVDNQLNVQGGSLIITDNNLILTSDAEIMGNNSDRYIITNGNGLIIRSVNQAGAEIEFPIGSTSGSFPCLISQGNSGSNTKIGARIASGVYAEGQAGTNLSLTESMVNHTWFIENMDSDASIDLNLQVQWDADAEVNGFNRDLCYISHFVDGAWDTSTAGSASVETNGQFSVRRQGISSLSPFRVIDDVASSLNKAKSKQYSIFPNPSNGWVNINGDISNNSWIRISDQLGQEVLSFPFIGNRNINLSELPRGIYFIQIENEGITKLVIQ